MKEILKIFTFYQDYLLIFFIGCTMPRSLSLKDFQKMALMVQYKLCNLIKYMFSIFLIINHQIKTNY